MATPQFGQTGRQHGIRSSGEGSSLNTERRANCNGRTTAAPSTTTAAT